MIKQIKIELKIIETFNICLEHELRRLIFVLNNLIINNVLLKYYWLQK